MSDIKTRGILGRSTFNFDIFFNEEDVTVDYDMMWDMIFDYNETWNQSLHSMLFLPRDDELISFYRLMHVIYRTIMRDPSRTFIDFILSDISEQKKSFDKRMSDISIPSTESKKLKLFVETNYQFIMVNIDTILKGTIKSEDDGIMLVTLISILIHLASIIMKTESISMKE